jgi:fatty aldehyde-generating acyl-ACP reductase
VIHPLHAKDLARKYPVARYLPAEAIEFYLERRKPAIVSRITGVKSKTGAETEGWFIGLPLTPNQMLKTMPIEKVYDRIVACCDAAAGQGADLIGLGAFSSVVGDGGISVAQRSKIPVTTGNSYTVATAIEGLLEASRLVEMDVANATLAVVGATGSIGRTCAIMLARQFGQVLLVGRDLERTQAVAKEIPGAVATTNFEDLRSADAVVTVTSSESEVIQPEHLKIGAVVCDVARPRDVSKRVSKERSDVLVIEGGVVQVPGEVKFGFDFGFPERMAYACMSETMMLALEGDPKLFPLTVGKDVSVEQVELTIRLAAKHGFKLSGFRNFEQAVDDEVIARVRKARSISRVVPRAAFG